MGIFLLIYFVFVITTDGYDDDIYSDREPIIEFQTLIDFIKSFFE